MELHESKAEIYETWAAMNRAFEQIISGLAKLEKIGVLSGDYVQDQDTLQMTFGRGLTRRSSKM